METATMTGYFKKLFLNFQVGEKLLLILENP